MTRKRTKEPWAERQATALHAAEFSFRKELRDMIAVVPDPREYVYHMTDNMVEALLCAERRGSTLMLPKRLAAYLRPYGLVDYASDFLTAFGAAVFRVLTEEHNA